MKKCIGIILTAMLAIAAFSGCNTAQNAGSTVSEIASDAVSGAGRIVDDVGDGIANAPSAAKEDADRMMDNDNNGKVEDKDGFIGNEDETRDMTVGTTYADTTSATD